MKRLLTIASIGLNLALAFLVYFRINGGSESVPPPMESAADPSIEIWEVVRVSDGDTIAVRQGNEERKIRLCGVDTPEKSQPGGSEATEFTKEAIAAGGGTVGIDFVEVDRYGRWIAEIWTEPGQNQQLLNSLLIDMGFAWPYKQYWGNCPNRSALEASEKSAEESGRAIWKQNNAIAPWEWRRSR